MNKYKKGKKIKFNRSVGLGMDRTGVERGKAKLGM